MSAQKCKVYELYQETMVRYSTNLSISYDKARMVLALYRVPKYLRMEIVKQMIEYGYLSRVNKDEIKIILD